MLLIVLDLSDYGRRGKAAGEAEAPRSFLARNVYSGQKTDVPVSAQRRDNPRSYLARNVYSGQKTDVPVSAQRRDNPMTPVHDLHRTRGGFD